MLKPKRELVSAVAYLLGLPKYKYEIQFADYSDKWDEYQKSKEMRTVRELCVLRNIFLSKYENLDEFSVSTIKNQIDEPNLIDHDSVDYLTSVGISVFQPNTNSFGYIEFFNKMLSEHTPMLKNSDCLPTWLPMKSFIKIFEMHGKVKYAVNAYNRYYSNYPYQLWVSWNMSNMMRNLLRDDKIFLEYMHKFNNERPVNYDKFVMEMPNTVKQESIEKEGVLDSFVSNLNRVLVVVDCENAAVSTVVSVLSSVNDEDCIYKVLLVDDENSIDNWEWVKSFSDLSIEHIKMNRLIQEKSVVDMKLALTVQKEILRSDVDGVLLISSDSDYSCLIETVYPDCDKFFVVYEVTDTCEKYIERLKELGVSFASSADFEFVDVEFERKSIIQSRLIKELNERYSFNINSIVEEMSDTLSLSDKDKDEFASFLTKHLSVRFNSDGECVFTASGIM